MSNSTSARDVLVLPRTTAIELMHAAQLSPQHAIAGVLGLRDGMAAGLTPSAADDAQALACARSQAREQGGEFALYYSQPAAAAEPHDLPRALREAASDLPLLIVSLNTKGVLETRAWRWRDNQYIEQTLTAIEPPTAA